MGKKNPTLCERPWCRELWTKQVSGFNERLRRGWILHVCARHAEPYVGLDGTRKEAR